MKHLLLKNIIFENIAKNLLVLIAVIFALPAINNSLNSMKSESLPNFLTIVSILLVTVCFANFGFSYGSVKENAYTSKVLRYFSHITTFLFMMITALLLVVLVISIGLVYPSLYAMFLWISLLLYLSIVFYDFWDTLRCFYQ